MWDNHIESIMKKSTFSVTITPGVLYVRRSRLKHRGDRAFAIAGPKLRNSLPGSIRMVSSLSSFKFKLKAHLLSVGS